MRLDERPEPPRLFETGRGNGLGPMLIHVGPPDGAVLVHAHYRSMSMCDIALRLQQGSPGSCEGSGCCRSRPHELTGRTTQHSAASLPCVEIGLSYANRSKPFVCQRTTLAFGRPDKTSDKDRLLCRRYRPATQSSGDVACRI